MTGRESELEAGRTQFVMNPSWKGGHAEDPQLTEEDLAMFGPPKSLVRGQVEFWQMSFESDVLLRPMARSIAEWKTPERISQQANHNILLVGHQ